MLPMNEFAARSIRSYTPRALAGAIKSLSYRGQHWPDRLTLLLAEKSRREREDREAEEPSQYQTVHRGCPP